MFYLKREPAQIANALLSEPALADDWNGLEEDAASSHRQSSLARFRLPRAGFVKTRQDFQVSNYAVEYSPNWRM